MGAKKGTIPQSTKNRVWFKYSTLFIFKLLWENQKKGLKKTKLSLCIFMAQKNKTFRALWIKSHPKKTYPKDLEERKYIGLNLTMTKRQSFLQSPQRVQTEKKLLPDLYLAI